MVWVGSANQEPEPDESERPGRREYPMRAEKIRLIMDDRAARWDPMSRANLAKIYTHEHNVKVKNIGMIHEGSLDALLAVFWRVQFENTAETDPYRALIQRNAMAAAQHRRQRDEENEYAKTAADVRGIENDYHHDYDDGRYRSGEIQDRSGDREEQGDHQNRGTTVTQQARSLTSRHMNADRTRQQSSVLTVAQLQQTQGRSRQDAYERQHTELATPSDESTMVARSIQSSASHDTVDQHQDSRNTQLSELERQTSTSASTTMGKLAAGAHTCLSLFKEVLSNVSTTPSEARWTGTTETSWSSEKTRLQLWLADLEMLNTENAETEGSVQRMAAILKDLEIELIEGTASISTQRCSLIVADQISKVALVAADSRPPYEEIADSTNPMITGAADDDLEGFYELAERLEAIRELIDSLFRVTNQQYHWQTLRNNPLLVPSAEGGGDSLGEESWENEVNRSSDDELDH